MRAGLPTDGSASGFERVNVDKLLAEKLTGLSLCDLEISCESYLRLTKIMEGVENFLQRADLAVSKLASTDRLLSKR